MDKRVPDKSRHEVNLRRLLAKCELILKSKNGRDDERFPKYVLSADEILNEVKTIGAEPSNILDYERRIQNLKKQAGLACESDELGNHPNESISPRDELLGLRQRTTAKSPQVGELDELINYHQNAQAKIADDMLILTQNLKEQSELANKIIKKDTEVVGKSSQLTENNYAKLKVESEKLQEHSKRACKCWMWIMLVVVLVVFINMVLFMKVMKKK